MSKDNPHSPVLEANKSLDRPWQTSGHGHYEYIETICDAHQAGITDGLAGKALMNPYFYRENPDQHAAFEAGHLVGVGQANKLPPMSDAEWRNKLAAIEEQLSAALSGQPAPTVPAQDARERFEAWAIGVGFDVSRDTYGHYHAQSLEQRWDAWRAALAHQPAQEQAEPLVILTLGGLDGGEYDANDIEIASSARLEELQRRLVHTEAPVVLNLYLAEQKDPAASPTVPASVEQILKLVCEYTGMRVSLSNMQLDEYIAFVRALESIHAHQPAQKQVEPDPNIRGPLTDAQRSECRDLYNNLKHLQSGGYNTADDVIRRAAVFGYMNGRYDFAAHQEPVAAHQYVSAPDGYAFVPLEATEAMLLATKGKNTSEPSWNSYSKKRHAKIYSQMVRAAQTEGNKNELSNS